MESDEIRQIIGSAQSDLQVARYSILEARERLSDVKAALTRINSSALDFVLGRAALLQIDKDLEDTMLEITESNYHLDAYRLTL